MCVCTFAEQGFYVSKHCRAMFRIGFHLSVYIFKVLHSQPNNPCGLVAEQICSTTLPTHPSASILRGTICRQTLTVRIWAEFANKWHTGGPWNSTTNSARRALDLHERECNTAGRRIPCPPTKCNHNQLFILLRKQMKQKLYTIHDTAMHDLLSTKDILISL